MVGFVSKVGSKKLKYTGLSSLGRIVCGPGAGEAHNGSAARMCSIHVLIQIFRFVFQLGSVAGIRW